MLGVREPAGLLSVARGAVGRSEVPGRPGGGDTRTLTLADTLGSLGDGAAVLRERLCDAEDDLLGPRLAGVLADRLELGPALPGRVVSLVGA